jgi:hypothetical protein
MRQLTLFDSYRHPHSSSMHTHPNKLCQHNQDSHTLANINYMNYTYTSACVCMCRCNYDYCTGAH